MPAHADKPNPSLCDQPTREPRRGAQPIGRLIDGQQFFHDHHPLWSIRWSGSRPPRWRWCGLRPGRQGHFVSCGFAALTLDRQPGDQGLAGYRGGRGVWSGSADRIRIQLPNGCAQAPFRGFVLGAPPLPFEDGGEDDPGVGLWVGLGVGPDEPGRPSGRVTVAASRSISGATMPALSWASRTTVARSALCCRREYYPRFDQVNSLRRRRSSPAIIAAGRWQTLVHVDGRW